MAHSDPLALLTDQITGRSGTPPDTYYVEASCEGIYPAVLDILAPLGKAEAEAVIRDIDEAFSAIVDATMRYKEIYGCLRVASLMVDGLTPVAPIDVLDDEYVGAVPQGQTQTALYAITEEVLGKHGLDPSSKPIQSDRYLTLRSTSIATRGQSIIEFDELVRHCHSIDITNRLLGAHLGDVGAKWKALIAHHIQPKKDVGNEEAKRFHIDVARVLGFNVRPHSTASCYSEPVDMPEDDYLALTQAMHLRSPDRWSDTVTWDVTDASTYAGTGIRRLTSFFSGDMLDGLSHLLGRHWSDMLTDVRVDWQVLLQDTDSVRIRFAPQVQLNPVLIKSVQPWFGTVTKYEDTWLPDHTKAALDYARMLVSSLVFDVWAGLKPLKPFDLRRDERALQLIVGPERADLVMDPGSVSFGRLITGSSPFGSRSDSPTPKLDAKGEIARNYSYVVGTSANVALRVYDMVNRASNLDDEQIGLNVRWVDTLTRLEEAYGVDGSDLRADIGLTQALAGPTWLRNEWELWNDGYAYPASRCAEVSPRVNEFGPGLQLASTRSYDRLAF